jgi:hypothetical protein
MTLYSTAQAAAYLGFGVDALKYHLRVGHLTPQKIGHSLVYTQEELDRFLLARRPPGRPRQEESHESAV